MTDVRAMIAGWDDTRLAAEFELATATMEDERQSEEFRICATAAAALMADEIMRRREKQP